MEMENAVRMTRKIEGCQIVIPERREGEKEKRETVGNLKSTLVRRRVHPRSKSARSAR